jgi:hypothetical protein
MKMRWLRAVPRGLNWRRIVEGMRLFFDPDYRPGRLHHDQSPIAQLERLADVAFPATGDR